ncbi:PaaI family thioesterase [Pleionea sediminis]|uniref:PaaI family thioesterase n=1 Tax=Pleionea sediminis TaxID=2569479 RepID=UPI001184D8F4|nr:PaaI family thioesterase [Pleionea sediminis]
MNAKLEQLKYHPYHQYLGVVDIVNENNSVELHANVSENTINFSGVYHGGAIYSLCDVCAYASLVSSLENNQEAVTHDIHVSLLRPVVENERVIYKSTIRKLGRSLCFIDVEVTANGKLIATARVTKSIVIKIES